MIFGFIEQTIDSIQFAQICSHISVTCYLIGGYAGWNFRKSKKMLSLVTLNNVEVYFDEFEEMEWDTVCR